jgi:D-glycero-beta-D-manno-heptose-7-phosphate kinase
MRILIIGESCLDVFVYGKVERLEPAAPVPVVQTINVVENGGMAMNVKNNFSSLGVEAEIITNSNWREIKKMRIVEKKTNHMFLRWDQNDNKYGRTKLKNIDFSVYTAVVISDYNKGFLSINDIKEISKSHDLVFLDTKKPIGTWARDIAFIKINSEEFNRAKKMNEEIKDKLIVTLGPNGALYRGTTYPVQKTEVKDLSGAGDTFLAALCKNFCETKDIVKAIRFANECSTKVVQKTGVATI